MLRRDRARNDIGRHFPESRELRVLRRWPAGDAGLGAAVAMPPAVPQPLIDSPTSCAPPPPAVLPPPAAPRLTDLLPAAQPRLPDLLPAAQPRLTDLLPAAQPRLPDLLPAALSRLDAYQPAAPLLRHRPQV